MKCSCILLFLIIPFCQRGPESARQTVLQTWTCISTLLALVEREGKGMWPPVSLKAQGSSHTCLKPPILHAARVLAWHSSGYATSPVTCSQALTLCQAQQFTLWWTHPEKQIWYQTAAEQCLYGLAVTMPLRFRIQDQTRNNNNKNCN